MLKSLYGVLIATVLLFALAGNAAAQDCTKQVVNACGLEWIDGFWQSYMDDGFVCVNSWANYCGGPLSNPNSWVWICTRTLCPNPPPTSPFETAPGPNQPPCNSPCGCGTGTSGGSGPSAGAGSGSSGGAASSGPSPPPCAASAGGPINFATGNVYIQQTDFQVPGLGGGLHLTRTWNSMVPASQSAGMGIMGIFGVNWKTEYEEYVYFASDGTWKYVRGDGAYWSFWAYEPPTVWLPAAPANAAITLGFSQDTTTATINFGNGERRVFRTSDGKLTAITDRNGNTTALSYDNYGNLTDVTDPASRNLYFSYTTDAHGEPVVQSVTSDVGLTAAYTYNSDGSLSSVTEPDGRVFNFEYGGASFLGPPEYSSPTQITPPLITAVTDKNNKVLEEHTYDVYGRALTSSRYDGAREVESVTLSYPGWTPPTPAPLPPIVPPETVLP